MILTPSSYVYPKINYDHFFCFLSKETFSQIWKFSLLFPPTASQVFLLCVRNLTRGPWSSMMWAPNQYYNCKSCIVRFPFLNSEIFSVVPSPVTQQLLLHHSTQGYAQPHSIILLFFTLYFVYQITHCECNRSNCFTNADTKMNGHFFLLASIFTLKLCSMV